MNILLGGGVDMNSISSVQHEKASMTETLFPNHSLFLGISESNRANGWI
jgi:hypothetical protein